MPVRVRRRLVALAFVALVVALVIALYRSKTGTSTETNPAAPVVPAPSRLAKYESEAAPRPAPPGQDKDKPKHDRARHSAPAAPDELFGPLVALGQGLTLGEALARNAAHADEFVEELCDNARKLRERPLDSGPPSEPTQTPQPSWPP